MTDKENMIPYLSFNPFKVLGEENSFEREEKRLRIEERRVDSEGTKMGSEERRL